MQDSAAVFDSVYVFGNSFKVLGLTINLDMHEMWHVLLIRVTIFVVTFDSILVAINNVSAARILTKYGIT